MAEFISFTKVGFFQEDTAVFVWLRLKELLLRKHILLCNGLPESSINFPQNAYSFFAMTGSRPRARGP